MARIVTTKQQGARAMSGTPFNWTVVWQDRGGGSDLKGSSSYRSREAALDAACEYNRYQTAVRIEGPNGEVIGRVVIEQLCKGRPGWP
jgi:hypothetical protein